MFEVDKALLKEISQAAKNKEDMTRFKGRSTLRLVQSISTIPSAFPTEMNTCGRICVHKSGRFVVVSNRGHQSIAIFRVQHKGPKRGELIAVGYFHTRGETPRHFQFDSSGQYLIVANQDSDSIAVFSFNLGTGEIKYTGNEYRVPSPNFVCCCPNYQDDEDLMDEETGTAVVATSTVTGPTNTKDIQVAMTRNRSDSGVSDSDSTTPVNKDDKQEEAKKDDVDLKAQLARANEEIEALRKQLLAFTATAN